MSGSACAARMANEWPASGRYAISLTPPSFRTRNTACCHAGAVVALTPRIIERHSRCRPMQFRDGTMRSRHSMDLKQLTALVTVAEVGSVTKAARLLHVVQSAVTRQIRSLEEEMGVPLFERTRQGMIATPAGEALVERARHALHEIERARAEIRPDVRDVTGIVTVGVLESVIDVLVDPLVAAVREHHAGIDLRIVTAYSGHLQE